jgi:ribosome maturation factor RimP
MTTTIDTDRLWGICENALQTVGYDLVDLEYVRDPHGWVLRVFIDHPPPPTVPRPQDAGPPPVEPSTITHADCELASQQLGTVLDVEDVIPNAYRLEVSSPGVQRPLRKQRDFARFVGHHVKIQLREPLEGRKNFVGKLRSAEGGEVGIEVDGRVFRLPLAMMKRARLELSPVAAAARRRSDEF